MVGVALEGGGARGAYHVGAIKALIDKGIYPDCYVGTSIGAINAAIASTGNIDKIVKLWKSTDTKTLFGIDDKVLKEIKDKNITKQVLIETFEISKELIKQKGIDIDNVRKFLEKIIDEEEIRNSKIDFGLLTFNLSDVKPVKIFKKDIPKGKIIEYLLASSYLPVFKSTKIIDGKYYMDGGIYNNLPTNMLIEKNYDTIYAVKTNTFDIVNKIKTKKNTNVVYIKPRRSLGSLLIFDPKKSKENIKLGYYDTLRVLEDLDGYKFYIKKRNNQYYDVVMKKVKLYDLNKLKVEYKTKNNKIIAIKLLETLAEELGIDEYKKYSFSSLLLRVKLLISSEHKQYRIIKNMKIKLL